ncbi:MAG: uroporphyrinogen-III synthase [Thiogranum sp.]|nr:uroporphyrinogen-III synthase [Thiogranum sp.]
MTGPAGSGVLKGIGVLVTRPRHQAQPLCELIEEHGGTVFRFPVLEIGEPADSRTLSQAIENLETFDWAIFISANAVEKAMTAILARRNWPVAVRIATIGRSSTEALSDFGLSTDLQPQQRFNSEALLELPEMQHVEGQRIVIFRGNGGREHLAETLRARGALVQYAEAYQRFRPQNDSGDLLRHWQRGEIDVVLINSEASLHNLIAMLGEAGRALLAGTRMLVVSERMIPIVESLGIQAPLLAADATDAAVLDALLAWRTGSR